MLYKEFTGRRYRVLESLDRLSNNDAGIVTLSQRELAEINNLSKSTLNKIMVWLRDNGFIFYVPPRKGYAVTEKGQEVIQKMNQEILEFED